MIGISFKYNPGYKSLLRDQYYELIKAFPETIVYERNVLEEEPSHYNGQPLNKVNDASDFPTEPTLVVLSGQNGVEIQGVTSLKNYVHPENAIYFFGDDNTDLCQMCIGSRLDYDTVYIPIDENIWSAQAIAIVLYDRQIKNG